MQHGFSHILHLSSREILHLHNSWYHVAELLNAELCLIITVSLCTKCTIHAGRRCAHMLIELLRAELLTSLGDHSIQVLHSLGIALQHGFGKTVRQW